MSMTDGPSRSAVEGELVTEAILDAAQAKVWRALTEPEIVADWLGSAGFEARAMPRFAIPPEADRPAIDCEILTADPPDRLSYAWREDAGQDSVVTFELSPAGPDRTRLRIGHRGVEPASRLRPLATPRPVSHMATRYAHAAPMRLAA